MNTIFDPSVLQIGNCEPVYLKLEQDPFWLPSINEKFDVQFNLQNSVYPSIEFSNILVLVRVEATAMSTGQNVVGLYSSIFRFVFSCPSLKDYSEIDNNGLIVNMHQLLHSSVVRLSLSSVRGLLRGVYANTIFAPYLLPMLTPQQVAGIEQVDIEWLNSLYTKKGA
ncbi:MAG: hypothetical protein AB8F78_07020 [Saprospiraceae bacterium]